MLNVSAAAVMIAGLTGPALAASEAEVKKCMSSVETVKEMRADSDSGQKALNMVDMLIGVSENLCEDEAIEDAKELLAVARGIMGTELGAGTEKIQ
jgi:hypothetical protein